MALAITHTFVDAIADDPADAAAGRVLPSHWNASHTFTGLVDATQLDQTVAYAFTGLGDTALASGKILKWAVDNTGSIGTNGANRPSIIYVANYVRAGGGFTLSSSGSNFLGMTQSGGNTAYLGYGGTPGSLGTAVIQWTDNSLVNIAPNNGITQFGAANAASPAAQTLQAQGSRAGTDTDVGGANFTLSSGTGTNGGTGSALIFTAPLVTGTGTAAQVQTEVVRVQGAAAPAWKWTANNSTGAGSAALGANSPASTLTAPYTWVKVLAGDGSTCYLPIWK